MCEACWTAFKAFDENDDGHISASELLTILEHQALQEGLATEGLARDCNCGLRLLGDKQRGLTCLGETKICSIEKPKGNVARFCWSLFTSGKPKGAPKPSRFQMGGYYRKTSRMIRFSIFPWVSLSQRVQVSSKNLLGLLFTPPKAILRRYSQYPLRFRPARVGHHSSDEP